MPKISDALVSSICQNPWIAEDIPAVETAAYKETALKCPYHKPIRVSDFIYEWKLEEPGCRPGRYKFTASGKFQCDSKPPYCNETCLKEKERTLNKKDFPFASKN
jgi:hypothetical protein